MAAKFTRRHYIQFARMIRDLRASSVGSDAATLLQAKMIDTFARDNPRFNESRFRAACVPSIFDASEPHTIGMDEPTEDNDPIGRFRFSVALADARIMCAFCSRGIHHERDCVTELDAWLRYRLRFDATSLLLQSPSALADGRLQTIDNALLMLTRPRRRR